MYTFINNPAALNAMLSARGIGNNPHSLVQTQDMVQDPRTGEMISRDEYLRRHGAMPPTPGSRPTPSVSAPTQGGTGGGQTRLGLPLRNPFGGGASFTPFSAKSSMMDGFANPLGRQRYNRSGK